MSLVNANPLILAPDGGYQISRSVRLRSSASAYFNRTPGSAGNRRTWTWSGWVKRGTLGAEQSVFSADTSNRDNIVFTSDNKLWVYFFSTSSGQVLTTQVFRDPSAWYHVTVAVDTTQATSSNRVKIYINGVLVTALDTASYPTQNYDGKINSTVSHAIGKDTSGTAYLDGYLTEINFIDGQALTPSSFGEIDVLTGVWKPKKYTGTYGTNGFFLNFSDNSSNTATTIGTDYSGNGNNWTPNNISVTSGSTYDSMLDVPTLWADGGNGRGNYATLNPVFAGSSSYLSGGNLNASISATNTNVVSTMQLPTSGKWYWEYQITTIGGGGAPMGGIATTSASSPAVFYRTNGNKLVDGTETSYGATYTTTDTIGVAVDVDSGTVTFYKNNSSQGNITYSGGGFYAALRSNAATDVFTINFGQRPFAYTPPTGFKALNTQNLPIPTIPRGDAYFNINTWTGDQSARTITNSGGMQPDFLWTKSRSAAEDHRLSDSVRGGNGTVLGTLASNTLGAEAFDTDVTGFTSSGFNIRAGTNSPNVTGRTYVGWQWKEGATPGFDIVTYTGNGVAGRTVAHSLGVTPAMTIVKDRSNGTNGWPVWHKAFANSQTLYLESTTGLLTRDRVTAVSSTTFTVSSHTEVNNNGNNYVAYLFAPVTGFSAFGSYTGNGSTDGPFCFTGFRPAFVMIKRTDATENWQLYDTARNTSNVVGEYLLPNSSSAGATITVLDILSSGFKIRVDGTNPGVNASGGTYVYACFASNPFKYSLAR